MSGSGKYTAERPMHWLIATWTNLVPAPGGTSGRVSSSCSARRLSRARPPVRRCRSVSDVVPGLAGCCGAAGLPGSATQGGPTHDVKEQVAAVPCYGKIIGLESDCFLNLWRHDCVVLGLMDGDGQSVSCNLVAAPAGPKSSRSSPHIRTWDGPSLIRPDTRIWIRARMSTRVRCCSTPAVWLMSTCKEAETL